MEELVTLRDIIKITGISQSELYRAMDIGKLPFRYIAGRRRVRVVDVNSYLNRGG